VTGHICHISGKNVTLSHKKIFFLTCDVFCHILPRKCHILAPPVQIFFERGEIWRFGWDWNMFFSSSLRFVTYPRKREAGRTFGLRPTLRNMPKDFGFWFLKDNTRIYSWQNWNSIPGWNFIIVNRLVTWDSLNENDIQLDLLKLFFHEGLRRPTLWVHCGLNLVENGPLVREGGNRLVWLQWFCPSFFLSHRT